MKFENVKHLIKQKVKTVDVKGFKFNIQQYIPHYEKKQIIDITLQQSLENSIYNEVLLDMYFHLNLIFTITDIEFSAEDREDYFTLFDNIIQSGLLNVVMENINREEYNQLLSYLKDQLTRNNEKQLSFVHLISSEFMDNLSKNAEAARNIVDSFDKEKYSEVINFAKAINNGKIN